MATTAAVVLFGRFFECPLMKADREVYEAYAKASSDPPELKKKYEDFITGKMHQRCWRCGGSGRISLMEKILPGRYAGP